jgi:hypothetical protein
MLDVSNFFWGSESTLHPIYFGVREYLEIKSRIQVLNERCRVFLDLAGLLSDSIADNRMSSKPPSVLLTPSYFDGIRALTFYARANIHYHLANHYLHLRDLVRSLPPIQDPIYTQCWLESENSDATSLHILEFFLLRYWESENQEPRLDFSPRVRRLQALF